MSVDVSFTRYRLQLRLHHAARLHFRHEVMLHSLLSEGLGRGELPDSVVPFACESGRVDFERGDDYRIGITIAGRAPEGFLEHLPRALAAYGARGFQGERIPMLRWFDVGKPEKLPAPDLAAECAALAGQQELVLQFVSPLRLEIPKSARGNASEFFDARRFPAEEFLGLLWNRLYFLAEGRFPHREESEKERPEVPAIVCNPRHLLWIDVPRLRKPSLGGVVGRLLMQNPGEAWLPMLVAGQYLHVGKSTGYGFGAYRIINRDGASLWNDPFGPSHTALERVAAPGRLGAAAQHVAAATQAGGVDGIGPKQFLEHEREIVATAVRQLADGSYKPSPLLGILLPKPHAKVRALAVPTLTDRTIQRAVLEVIGPAIETLLEDCSFAYRKGFSRAGAAQAIEKAYADGYRWVLDADIDSFFDAVDWERLFAKVEALYPFEPLTKLLRAWIAAPVVFEGALITRKQGLPQGAVISPLLANLFLDELDEELLGEDFRLVRYADDFVVLCKDVEAAERARDRALLHIGAALGVAAVARAIDYGLSDLGWLFSRPATVAGKGHDNGAGTIPEGPFATQAWLVQFDLSRTRELRQELPRQGSPHAIPNVQSPTE